MLFQTTPTATFKDWLFKDDENKLLLKWSFVATVITFVWLKVLYPFPNFMPPDSNSYIEAAENNEFINIWPIGYSKFLQILHFFTSSHFVLVIVQYLILQSSLLYLLFSIRYLFNPGKLLFRIILGISILNPLLPHISNFVSSDCLFISLSIVWYTQLMWIIYQPSKNLIIAHALILFLTFTVRHNAIYYPLITLTTVMLIKSAQHLKILTLTLVIVSIGLFISCTGYVYYKKTGHFQYSPFGGWQLAANALYGYAHTSLDKSDKVPNKFRELHNVVNERVGTYNYLPYFFRPDKEVGVYYLWDFQSPLRLYMDKKWHNDSNTHFFKKWASMAPLYAAYGGYLIKKHPQSFIVNYLWPNLQHFYAPPANFMGLYNIGNKTVDSIAVKWFDWKDNRLPALGTKKIWIADVFTIVTPVINVIFIAALLAIIMLKGLRDANYFSNKIILFTIMSWFTNVIFSVISAPIELRYQLFPLIFTAIWSVMFSSYIIGLVYSKQPVIKDGKIIKSKVAW